MTEKYVQPAQGYPVAPAASIPIDHQQYAANYQSQEQIQSKKRARRLAFIAAFVVIQTIVIASVVLVFLRVQTPRVRLTDVAVSNDTVNFSLTARVWIRNRNFGRYEFDGGLATVRSRNNELGQFLIPDAWVRARSTRRFQVVAQNLRVINGSGVLDLNVRARLGGEVRVLRVIRRNRWADLNCCMNVDLSTHVVRDLSCE